MKNIDELAEIKQVVASAQFNRDLSIFGVRLDILVAQGYDASRLRAVKDAAAAKKIKITITETK